MAPGELALGSEDAACPLPALPPTHSHLSSPLLLTSPALPARSDLPALSRSSFRGWREVSQERVAHFLGVRSESKCGGGRPQTSPSVSFRFLLNPDCESGSTHVTGWHCGGGSRGQRGRGTTATAMIKVINNCLKAYCMPGTVLNGFPGRSHLHPRNNSMSQVLLPTFNG